MKVLFDISVLGIGHVTNKARTGIFRVIENIAEQLVLHPECHVKFFISKNESSISSAESYLKNTKALSKASFSKPPFFDRLINIGIEKDALIKLIITNESLPSFKKLRIQLRIKELIVMEKLFRIHNNGLLHPRDLKKARIYHSPFYPLPANVSSGKYKSVFITCYDLIPVLFPQYFEQSILDTMTGILNSITPETWVLCISESTRNDLLNHLGNQVNPDKVVVTELAASDTFYQSTDKELNLEVRRKHHIPDAPFILSLCTFEPRKNIEQVIKAFAKIIVQENIRDLHLVLVGNTGWMFEKIFNEIENSEAVKSRIIITGFVADKDLSALYSDALFFVYPSFYEGFGLPPLEAMKCGTPVITSNTSSLPEVVGDAGIMVAPSDLDELCQAMLSVYKNPALQQQMAAKSKARASLFSWERCGKQTVEAYAASLKK